MSANDGRASSKHVNHLTREGAELGVKLGLGLSALYTLLLFCVEAVSYLLLPNGTSSAGSIIALLLAGLLVIGPIAILTGIVPATFLGLVTGALLGLTRDRLLSQLSRRSFAVVSAAISALIVLALHLALAPDLTAFFRQGLDPSALGPADSYPALAGVPSAIYIATGGFIGWRLAQLAEPSDVESIES